MALHDLADGFCRRADAAFRRRKHVLRWFDAPRLEPLEQVRVNGICCGAVDTPTLRGQRTPQEMRALSGAVAQTNLAGRLATAQDVADAVILLCGDEARWIYGQTILADGGEELLLG
jgi:NAD(P)-dependent dehydrogenase (short-subunit alcohol dehydrogenase family)